MQLIVFKLLLIFRVFLCGQYNFFCLFCVVCYIVVFLKIFFICLASIFLNVNFVNNNYFLFFKYSMPSRLFEFSWAFCILSIALSFSCVKLFCHTEPKFSKTIFYEYDINMLHILNWSSKCWYLPKLRKCLLTKSATELNIFFL